jgi:predicted porin
MKKLSSATIVALACQGVCAQTGITLSGTADSGLRYVSNGSVGSDVTVVSGANSTSKIIVRGIEDLGDGLSAGFYFDGTVLIDTGLAGSNAPPGQFWDRRSTVNLTHVRWGELRLGRDWVPTHLVWTALDPFTTLGIASANTFRSVAASRALGQAFGTTAETQSANSGLRVSNAIEYWLPPGLGGVYGSLIKSYSEKGATFAGFTKGEGFRLGWAGGPVNIAAAQFSTKNTQIGRTFKDQAYGLSYDLGFAKLSLGQRRLEFGPERTNSTLLGAIIPAGPGVVKLSYVKANQSGLGSDASLIGAGYVYSLSKRTALYAHVARLQNQGTGTFAIPGGPPVSANPTAANFFGGGRSTGYEIGVRHDF